jgi:hypothetical protein
VTEQPQDHRQNPDAPGQARVFHCVNARGQRATLCLWSRPNAWGLAAFGPCPLPARSGA